MKQILHPLTKTLALSVLAFPLMFSAGCSEKEVTDSVPDPVEEPGPADSDLPEPAPKKN
jgi:hypothetical protein